MVYAKFERLGGGGGQTECVMGDSKIDDIDATMFERQLYSLIVLLKHSYHWNTWRFRVFCDLKTMDRDYHETK